MTRAASADGAAAGGAVGATAMHPARFDDMTVAPPEALYLHVPFCVSLCPYCDFVVVAGSAARGPANRIASFGNALRRELELRADALDARWGPSGGHHAPGCCGRSTSAAGRRRSSRQPTLPGSSSSSGERYGLAADAEVTLEANPGPDERGDAAALARRRHHAALLRRPGHGRCDAPGPWAAGTGAMDVAAAVEEARAAGIPSVNLDLLYDVPGVSLGGWMATLESALALEPDHLSLYALTLDDPGCGGPHRPDRRPPADDPGRAAMARRGTGGPGRGPGRGDVPPRVHRLAEAGYDGYEISNWARPGHESRHNLAYWERRPYEAVGPGAHAFDGATRRWNAARLDGYIAALTPADGGPGRLPPGGEEPLDAATAAAERVILGLRTSRGIPASAGLEPPLAGHFGWALAAELLEVTPDDRIVLTTRGRLLSNELFARLV